MRKSLKIISLLVVLVVLAIGGCFGWFKYQEHSYASVTTPFIEKIVTQLTELNESSYRAFSVPLPKTTSDADLEKLTGVYKKLGKFKKMDAPRLVNVFTGSDPIVGLSTILTYNVRADFENDEAFITLRLVPSESEIKVYSLNVNSKAFLN